MSITEFVESPGYKKVMGKVYGLGAAVVILGALWKILHLPGANYMLIAGLGTEAIIFALSAFEKPHEMPDWGLVYPELHGLEPRERGGHGGGSELSALVQTGSLEAKDLEKLSDGIKKLGDTSSKLSDITNATAATDAYVQNVKSAGEAVGQFANQQATMAQSSQTLAGVYANSSEGLKANFDAIASNNEAYAKNLAAINSAYELQLQGVNSQVQASQALTQGLTEITDQFQQSANDAKMYREQIAQLSKSVSELNSIYGNMLSAMNMGNK